MEGTDIRVKISFSEDGPTLLERLRVIASNGAEEAPGPWNPSE